MPKGGILGAYLQSAFAFGALIVLICDGPLGAMGAHSGAILAFLAPAPVLLADCWLLIACIETHAAADVRSTQPHGFQRLTPWSVA
jgi:hypothetical protein